MPGTGIVSILCILIFVSVERLGLTWALKTLKFTLNDTFSPKKATPPRRPNSSQIQSFPGNKHLNI